MQGQWRGSYSGGNSGKMVVEIDDVGDHFEGTAYLYDSDPALPGVFARIKTLSKALDHRVVVHLLALHPQTGIPTPFSQLPEFYPDVTMSDTADAHFWIENDALNITWQTAIASGSANLPRSRAALPSECAILPIANWEQFKNFAARIEPYQFMFRGQPGRWRLRTAFHRTGRANLDKYLLNDLPIVHRHLSAVTRHSFDVRDPLQNAAFLSLIQHHGFPTPLLDWTYSPFIAAHFAFSTATAPADEKVRVYVFAKEDWQRSYNQVQNTADRRPHFSIVEALGFDNARMIPQQALSSFTNVDDIEGYIRSKETADKRFLSAIDLPVSELAVAVKELRLMGITPGALFPGLDGTCAELRERFFG